MATCYLLLVAFATLGAAQARTLPSSAEHALTVTAAADMLAPSPRATTITPDPKYEPLMCAGPLSLLACGTGLLHDCHAGSRCVHSSVLLHVSQVGSQLLITGLFVAQPERPAAHACQRGGDPQGVGLVSMAFLPPIALMRSMQPSADP